MARKEAVPPVAEPTAANHIGLGQLSVLATLKPAARIAIIAEGLPIILASAEDLIRSAEAVREKHARAADILERQALEEAAKILILLDYVRCPMGLSKRLQAQIKAFYDHGSRAIYAEACRWTAYDVETLRSYVDKTRASHFVEGDFGEWVIPNWEAYKREAQMYTDLSRTASGGLAWNDPLSWQSAGDNFQRFEHPVFRLVRALGRLGFYKEKSLQIFADIWRPHTFKSELEGSELAERLIKNTLSVFIASGFVTGDTFDDDLVIATRYWPLPMYEIDVDSRMVTLQELKEEQEWRVYDETI